MRLASRFGYANQIRRDRPLTHEELMHYVPGIFGEDKHTSRSQNYTYIPTITVLESLQREGFQPFFACQTRVRDPGRRGYTKHMLRLRRAGEINGEHVPEIILLNSHDGTSSYQMLPGYFRFVCQNGCVCGQSLGEVRVPHRGNVVEKVDITKVLEGIGVKNTVTVDALDLNACVDAVLKLSAMKGVKAVIFKSPCAAIIKSFRTCRIAEDRCVNCRTCINEIGCPALVLDGDMVRIDSGLCTGCGLCSQICSVDAIETVK